MELQQLRYFVAVAEAGSVTRAADRCGVAQPSLSQQIRKLEQALGAVLFDRLARGVALTEAGRALLPRARRIIAEVDEARTRLSADVDEGTGRFAIGAIPTIAPYLLPSVLVGLRREFPKCEVEVREDLTESLIEQLVDNQLDAAIVSTPIDHDQVRIQVVGSEEMLVVFPSSDRQPASGEITLAELRRLPRVSLHEMHCLGQQIAGFCVTRRLGSNIVCRTTQLATVLELVRMGLGISIVPEMAARHDDSSARHYARIKKHGPRREIAVATRLGRTAGIVVERVGALLEAALKP